MTRYPSFSSASLTLHVRCDDQRRVVDALQRLGRVGAVAGPLRRRWITVFDPRAEFDDGERSRLAKVLSAALECLTLIVSCLKYGRLGIDLFRDGAQAVEYLLDLDYVRGDPSPEKCDRAAEGVAERLLPFCRPGTASVHLDRLLRALEVSSGAMEGSADDLERRAAEREDMARMWHERGLHLPTSIDEAMTWVSAVRDSGAHDVTGVVEALERIQRAEGHTGTGVDASGERSRQDESFARSMRLEADEFRRRAAALRETPRPLRASCADDVLSDLCSLLELDVEVTEHDALHDMPGYPNGFVQVV